MSFNIALSGVAAAQKDLDTTANNIANVNTVGFKESRAEFGDVYAASLLAGGKTKVGDGVLTQEVAQQFTQGSLQFTNTSLDLAITGNGFFATVPDLTSRDTSFTRAGQFKLDENNFVVNTSGDHLLGFPVNPDGTSSSVALSTTVPVRIPDSSGSPQPTREVTMRMNLPANDEALDPANFDPDDTLTYNAATSVTVYDSLGESHIMTYYYVKDNTDLTNNPNRWHMFATVDDTPVNINGGINSGVTRPDPTNPANPPVPWTSATLNFNSSGDFVNQVPATIQTEILGLDGLGNGANALGGGAEQSQQINIDFNLEPTGQTVNEPTQYASAFEVTSLEQDGLPVGRLTGVDIGPDGLVRATFSNGTSEPVVRVALARFSNEQGLTQKSNTQWKESIESGEALAGEATTGTFGEINSSALEQANVNLTTELIDLIIAQRNFQANSRALEINNQLNQTILGIR
ncbi:MAG: flagellar hook protein FlgE [Alteromonadaceae bacterium]|nr:flagellar hook protein FlgE [Alteromonadaceae bacterium]